MTYLIYFFLALASLPITLLGLLLSPILPLFAAQEYGWSDNHAKLSFGPRLPKWLSWFQTPDNSLDGDYTFEQANPPSYFSQVKWLCRNPAYAFQLKYIGTPYNTYLVGDPTIKDNDNAKEGFCYVECNGLFQYRYIKKIPFTARCILINLGWNIMSVVDPNVNPKPSLTQATFVFSPRISGFR
jgi:hypothetical protein